MSPPPDTLLALASGVPLILLGGLLLAIRSRRSSQIVFGVFAVMWGVQVVTANVGRVLQDPDVHYRGLLLSYGALAATSLFLMHFATRARRAPWRLLPLGVATLLGLATAWALAFRPELLVQQVALREGDLLETTFGPWALPLVQAPFFLSFYYAILMLYLEYRRSAPGTQRHRYRGMVLAFMLFTSYVSARQLAMQAFPANDGDGVSTFASSAVRILGDWSALGQDVLFLGGFLLLLGVAVHLLLRPPVPEGRDYALLVAFLAPAATGFAEALLLQQGVVLETLGFWRFLTVGVLVYALARYQLFDLDLKLKGWAGPGVAGALIVFGVPVALTFATDNASPVALLSTLAAEGIAVGASLLFRDRISETLFPGVSRTETYVHQRQLDVYKVAMEDALERGVPLDSPELREVRLRLAITDHEHQILAWVLGSGTAPGAREAPLQVRPGSMVLDRYRVGALIGQGTAGGTYLAHDIAQRRTVALKIVGAAALGGGGARLLLRDARLSASLSHPNVLQVVDVGEVPGGVALVMEHAEGGNLENLLSRRGPLPLEEAVQMADGILSALEVMHAKGIVHRNLKPKNILFARDGRAQVADFAAARTSGGGDISEAEDAAAATLSLLYMSPEQVRGEPATPASDLYGVGVLLYQALTGRHPLPLAGKDDSAIRDLVLHGEPDLARQLPRRHAAVEAVLARALARDPAARYGSAGEMRAALAGAARSAPEAAAPTA